MEKKLIHPHHFEGGLEGASDKEKIIILEGKIIELEERVQEQEDVIRQVRALQNLLYDHVLPYWLPKMKELSDILELVKNSISVETRENVDKVEKLSHVNSDYSASNNNCHVRKSLIPVENSGCNVEKERNFDSSSDMSEYHSSLDISEHRSICKMKKHCKHVKSIGNTSRAEKRSQDQQKFPSKYRNSNRARNLVIFNKGQTEMLSLGETKEKSVENFILQNFQIKARVQNVKQLGPKSTSHCPLLVTFDSVQVKRKVLNEAKRTYSRNEQLSHVFWQEDMTLVQRKRIRDLIVQKKNCEAREPTYKWTVKNFKIVRSSKQKTFWNTSDYHQSTYNTGIRWHDMI